ncbi:MAG: pyridoxal phosphate-dependent aminotransferase [Thermohalobaculum sp.]|nr:pyridoxal phosphate-dependent aminotransferase [Thermohalobaculum sp.]
MSRPALSRIVEGLPATVPFVGPEQQERDRGRPFAARIGANESVFGPSPRAVAAIAKAAHDAWMYGDPTTHELRAALAAALGVGADSIVIGEGIDGLLGLTVRLFVNPGDVVVTSAGAYPTFNYHVAGFGARLVTVPYRADAEDPEALAEAARAHGARLVYLANPDNPMGSWHDARTVERLVAALPAGCILCLDEAYVEFAPGGTAPAFDVSDPRVIRFRTFSKAHGLAGLRVGYAVSDPRVINAYERIRNHFGIGRVAQAGALAALGDRDHLARVVAEVEASRIEIARIAAENGLRPLPSATNFVAVDCGHDGAFARAVLRGLIARDVFVRMPGIASLDRTIRVSCGRAHDLALFAAALPAALAEARAAPPA